ncbi:microfibril-associated glycoprotein 4-like [Siniperca chuatsi]|uniref:microfibril-associated glycoprotein 4-like n=1 Tax=Siniperca chuatsi TaxID=119488 RepID=UPI001CE0443F|nr:microfibril-associated glycoprotein 4-like [Siniperca chuatsi]
MTSFKQVQQLNASPDETWSPDEGRGPRCPINGSMNEDRSSRSSQPHGDRLTRLSSFISDVLLLILSHLDWSDIRHQDKSLPSGVYTIYPAGERSAVQVYCDMESEGAQWTVICTCVYIARACVCVGSDLDNIHYLTRNQKYELLVDMEDFEGKKVFARYYSFAVDSEHEGYLLNVFGFINGGAGDSLRSHDGQKFSTFDKDQDSWSGNCARLYLGAFWYNACHHANPNGVYHWGADKTLFAVGVECFFWKGNDYSLKTISMKIRRVQ